MTDPLSESTLECELSSSSALIFENRELALADSMFDSDGSAGFGEEASLPRSICLMFEYKSDIMTTMAVTAMETISMTANIVRSCLFGVGNTY
jgi:hypothetical protein